MPQGAQQPATITCDHPMHPGKRKKNNQSRSKKRKRNAFVMVWGGPQPPLLLKAAGSRLSTSHVWELLAALRPLSG